ncbi:hypothetical protein K469DRAFT_272304 [Zopfia rhizophila CBS 207.26]|uniref:Uncharacterized protein n=1 Tax=Zopfia rhizophila CBS 207.26 TaxID=1314779 RepID=A0A6A6DLU1_9PEZI|nr:hypothetical protein K469DRAFT_272304 [Zopfia rhizophila CBS 207.26]
MLMSYSWITFILGYVLHLPAPVIRREIWTIECTCALMAFFIGVVAGVNFVVTSLVARNVIPLAKVAKEIDRNDREELAAERTEIEVPKAYSSVESLGGLV